MRLYLVRHGEALSADIDLQRPLSAAGQQQVTRLAEFLGQLSLQVSYVYHSGVLRAQQTAEILASKIAVKGAVEKILGLNPNDPVQPMAIEAETWHYDVMLVGHLPFLSELVSELLIGRSYQQVMNFQPSSILCLERQLGHWHINWALSPDFLVNSSP